ncbi:MAG: SGNH/GDSL hydrolase family protein [Lentisphaeria bacterium]|nr:SGNH/GDSL hydrolase family protein [Lentisphaeria bacterium]
MKNFNFIAASAVAATALTAFADYHHTFEKGSGGWVHYNYWGGKLENSSEAPRTGKKSLKLTSSEKRGKVYGLTICPIPSRDITGTRVRLTFYAKGSGEIAAGVLNYTRNSRGGEKMTYAYADAVKLTDQYQKVEYIADYTENFVEKIAPAIELRGKGVAYIDDLDIVYEKNKAVSIKPLGKHLSLREGEKLPQVKFKTSVPDETVQFFAIPENRKFQPVQSSVIADEKGIAVYEPGDPLPAGMLKLTAAVKGVNANWYAQIVPTAEYDAMLKDASAIKLAKPCHILFLGDSITDRDRGYNYADILTGWLNKTNPGKVSFQNLAVSGDFITRVEKRMTWKKGKRQEWKQWVYNDLHNRPYDLIIIALGANDCASFKSSNYKKPQVALAEAEASFKRVIDLLRTKSKAPIILVTPIANNVELSKKNGAISVRYGGVGAVFGLPEFVNPFNAMLKKVAKEKNCYLLDLHSMMQGNANIPKWCLRDAVHLTEAGQQAVAAFMLKGLAAEGSPLK